MGDIVSALKAEGGDMGGLTVSATQILCVGTVANCIREGPILVAGIILLLATTGPTLM